MNYTRSYVPHYFAMEDIIATSERLPCKFTVPALGLGFLDQASDSEDIAEGTKLELPFWLAQPLSTQRRAVVSVEIPKVFRECYRDILKADAKKVDLYRICIFFYEFGSYICELNHNEAIPVAEILVQILKQRFRLVMDWAVLAGTFVTMALKMDYLEMTLFREGNDALNRLDQWLTKAGFRVNEADLVARQSPEILWSCCASQRNKRRRLQ